MPMGRARQEAEIALLNAETLVATVQGFLSLPRLDAVLRRAAEALEDRSERRTVVLDLTGAEGFQPGTPARLVAWMRAHTEQVVGVVLVSPSQVLGAAARAASLLLPEQSLRVAGSRAEALAALAPPRVDRRKRSSSGAYPSETRAASPLQKRSA